MRVFFRVHEDTLDSDHTLGQLFDENLARVDTDALDPDDVLFKISPEEFTTLCKGAAGGLAGIYFRVHEDKSNRDPNAGTWYDTRLNEVSWPPPPGDRKGNLILIPVTPEELQITKDARR